MAMMDNPSTEMATLPQPAPSSGEPQHSSQITDSAAERSGKAANFNYHAAFPHMLRRKAFRQTRGQFYKTRPIFTLVSFVLLTVLSLMANADIQQKTTPEGSTVRVVVLSPDITEMVGSPELTIAWSVITSLLVLGFLLFSLKLIVRYNLVLGQYLVILAIIAQAIFVLVKYAGSDDGQDNAGAQPSWVFSAFLYTMVVYLFVNWLYSKLYPALVVHPALMPKPSGMQVTAKESEDGGKQQVTATFSYRRALWKGPQVITYSGEVDEDGHPDGFGRWEDSHEKGETLEGTWSAGEPVGPFNSRDTKSSSGFVKLRVGFFSCRSEPTKPPQPVTFKPKHCGYDRSTVGVITAECCVSGAFFRDFPVMALGWEKPIFPEKGVAGSSDVEAQNNGCAASFSSVFQELCDDVSFICRQQAPSSYNDQSKLVLVMADPLSGISIPRFERDTQPDDDGESPDAEVSDATVLLRAPHVPNGSGGPRMRYEPRLEIDGWSRSGIDGKCTDAVIYIHGYNSSCDNGCRLIGQLWTFASFPAHVRPFVFSWPTGTLAAFPLSKRASEAPEVARSLRDMVVGIASTGIKRFHFMGHSMGIRPFCEALDMLEELFHSNLEKKNVRTGEICVQIDGCSDLVVLPQKLEMSSVTFLNPEYGARKFVSKYLKRIQAMCEVLTLYGDVNDLALKSAYWFINFDSWLTDQGPPWGDAKTILCGLKEHDIPLGKDFMAEELQMPPSDSSFAPLDLIDCTHLDVNVQDSRHNGFSLNRSLVEDIYDVITYRISASARTNRLDHLKGNVYEFKVAPKFVDGSNI